jgi:RHS repeat-associated protein
MTQTAPRLRGWQRRLSLLAATSVAVTVVTAAGPANATLGALSVTLTGPTTATLGVAVTYRGMATVAATGVGAPAQPVQLRLDGTAAATVTSGSDGGWSAAVAFVTYGPHTVEAVARPGDPLEASSGTLQTQVAASAPVGGTSTDIAASNTFLYQGAAAPQQGVAPGAITATRAAVLHGIARTTSGQPLTGVAVSVVGHPELGTTASRPDGGVDLVVNGGQPLTVTYAKPGFLPVDRTINVPWREFTSLPDVALPALDSAVSAVSSGSGTVQIARGSPVNDADGTRRATLVIPAGTSATMTLPNGDEQYLPGLHIRATEVTVGANGPAAMPADLPAGSAYTYAVDYTVDEALNAGAQTITFDHPLAAYTDNFLHFPAGTPVPAGYYDRARHAWVAAPDGIVLTVVSVTAGRADVDVTGDGVADGAAVLAPYGISDAERASLAGLYSGGASLWRVQVSHFTPWDYNYPYGPTPGATAPNQHGVVQPHRGCQSGGSIIGCAAQTLGEILPIAGTKMALRYDTSRVPGYAAKRSIDIGLTGATLPPGLQEVTLQVSVAGKQFTRTFAAQPNQRYEYIWDGVDVFGRPLQGAQTATVRIGYAYQATYYGPSAGGSDGFTRSFGQAGSALIIGDRARQLITFYQSYTEQLGGLLTGALGDIGGWTLTGHHAYDPDSSTLYLGDGATREATQLMSGLGTIAGTGAAGANNSGTYTGDAGPATAAGLSRIYGLAAASDGSILLADSDNGVIRKISPTGVISTVAGGANPAWGNGDGGPATAASLDYPVAVSVAPDGSILIADAGANRVRRISTQGTITTLAGGGAPVDGLGDFGPATSAMLANPRAVAVADDGTVYIADTNHSRIRKVTADGTISTVAGGGTPNDGVGDGLPGPQAALMAPQGIATGLNNDVWIGDTGHDRVRKLTADGLISTVAGNGITGNTGDGGSGTTATLDNPTALAVDRNNGTVFIAQPLSNTIRQVDAYGVIRLVAGSRTSGFSGDQGSALRARFHSPSALAVSRTGQLLIADRDNFRVRRVSAPLPGFGLTDTFVPSSDGAEVYQFNAAGRHLRTLDALTNIVTATFGYDAFGRLTTVADHFGNTTTINRDANGQPTGIDSPYGQHTILHVNASGYLDVITNPANEVVNLAYDGTSGLLIRFEDPRHNSSNFSYDTAGRLTSDTGPDGHATTLARVVTDSGLTVTATTALGHTTRYRTVALADGRTQQITTYPSSLSTTVTTTADGTVTTVDPDGTSATGVMSPDPRFGLAVPLMSSMTQTSPSGATITVTRQRTVTLSDPANPLSLSGLTDTTTLAGNTNTTSYTQPGRTLTTTGPGGGTIVTTLNNDGLPISSQTGSLNSVNYGYDTRGRMTSVSTGSAAAARTTTTSYGSDGYVSTVTNPLHTVSYSHDAVGRILDATLPDGNHVAGAYDATGELTSLTPAGRTAHNFDYTSAGLTQRYRPPAGAAGEAVDTAYAYNTDRQVTSVTLPGGATIVDGYDAAGRPATTTLARGALHFGYDPTSGQLTSLTGPDGQTTTSTLDGGLTTKVVATGSVPGVVNYTYDAAQRIAGVAVGSGATQNYAYDADGDPTTVAGLSLTWDTANRFYTGSSIGVGATAITTSRGYNNFADPVADSASVGGSTVYAADYGRDLLGRLSQRSETTNGNTTTNNYTYDSRGRLTDVSQAGSSTYHYSYDANGNRTSATSPAGTVTADYDAQDRLVRQGSATYTYAATGHLSTTTTPAGVTSYSYDELGELTHVGQPGGTSIDYLYDGAGRRIAKKVNGSMTTGWIYGTGPAPLAQTNGTGAVTSTFTYANSGTIPALITTGGITYRVVTDHLGSPRLVINTNTGVIAQRLDYDPFGRTTADSSPGLQPFGFTGGIVDPDTGFVHLGARDYDPVTGRFTSKDPTRFAGGDANLYAYAADDPVNNIDPSGLNWLDSTLNIVNKLNPFTPVVDLYQREIAAYESGCGYWQSVKYGLLGTGVAVVTVLLLASGGGEAAAARGAAEDGMAGVRAAGSFGERSAGIIKNTDHIPSLSDTAAYRIPDELNATTLGEVKNVGSLSYTSQLRDFSAYAQQEGLTFNLYVRGSTTFSGPLQDAVDAGWINVIRNLPG